MKTYTLHLPSGALRGDSGALDRAALVPDGFSWGAFVFTAFWFFWHRLWLAGLIVGSLLVGLVAAARLIGLPPMGSFLVMLLASTLIGLEASSLRRWTYGRQGRPAREAVVAATRDEAEAKAFAKWLGAPAAIRREPAAPAGLPRSSGGDVIGLFPPSEVVR